MWNRSVAMTVMALIVCLDAAGGEEGEAHLALSPPARQAFERGVEHLRAGEFQQAVDLFTEVIREYPRFADAYEYRAEAYRGMEREAKSQQARDRASIRYRADQFQAAELRAEKRIAQRVADEMAATMLTALGLACYVLCWLGVLVLWWHKGLDLRWPIVACVGSTLMAPLVPRTLVGFGFWLSGVGVLVFFALYACFETAPLSPRRKKPFDDHPFERALGDEPTGRGGAALVSDGGTSPCPKCGRELAVTTRICPRCETRLA